MSKIERIDLLMVDLKHDYVRTFVSRFDDIEWAVLGGVFDNMITAGPVHLAEEKIPESQRRFTAKFK